MNQLFIDNITNMTFHGGVLRIECAAVGHEGKLSPTGVLIIPGPAASHVLQTLMKGAQELDKKMREAHTQQPQQPAAGTA
jgi:hypothetical protein